MDWLRQKVSGPKQRYQDDKYNLDLTYITPRLVAMAFPADKWIEKIYRNSIQDVSQMIKEKHQENYLIINLSCRQYDSSYFGEGKVVAYEWEDHHSPSLKILFEICEKIQLFLQENKKNVAIAHCKAGKGRTGTIICCYLIFSGQFDNPDEALTFYSKKRFTKDGLGVNQPCQIRYVYYFWEILRIKKNKYLIPKDLVSVMMKKRPNISHGGCRPFIVVSDVATGQEFYNTKASYAEQEAYHDKNAFEIKLDEKQPPIVGDILIKFYQNSRIKNQKIFRLAFNAFFIGKDNQLVFKKSELSPSQILDDNRFPEDFEVILSFKNICKACNEDTKFSERCKICQNIFHSRKIDTEWNIIYSIVNKYKRPTAEETKQLLFGDENDSVKELMSQLKPNQILQRPPQFRDVVAQIQDDFMLNIGSQAPKTLQIQKPERKDNDGETQIKQKQNSLLEETHQNRYQKRRSSSQDNKKEEYKVDNFDDSNSDDEYVKKETPPDMGNYQKLAQQNNLQKINLDNNQEKVPSKDSSPLKE